MAYADYYHGHDVFNEEKGAFVYDNHQSSQDPKYLYHYTSRKHMGQMLGRKGNYTLGGGAGQSHGPGVYFTSMPPQTMAKYLAKNNWCVKVQDYDFLDGDKTEGYFRIPTEWIRVRGGREVDHFCPGGNNACGMEWKSKSVWILPNQSIDLNDLEGIKGWKVGLRKEHMHDKKAVWQDFNELKDAAWA